MARLEKLVLKECRYDLILSNLQTLKRGFVGTAPYLNQIIQV